MRFVRKQKTRPDRGPLKVMFVITSMPVGGAETLLVNMMNRFDPTKIVPEVCCLKEKGPLGEKIQDQFAVHSDLWRSKFDPSIVLRLARLYRQQEVDAIVTVGAGDKMFWGRLAAAAARVPVIASALHSTGWPDGVGRLNRLLTPITDAFIGVADSHAKHLREMERFPDNKVFAIRNGIDTQRFHPNAHCDAEAASESVRSELGIPPHAPIGIIVAALREEKHHKMFVDVARKVQQNVPESHFVIVGDGPERENIERWRSEAGLEQRLHMLGTRHDTPRLLAASEAFLLCSHNEASPVSILEALACETAVVSTDVGSISETVNPDETGFLVPAGDTAAMTDHVTRLFQDAALRKKLGSAGRELVAKQGSLDSMVGGYQSLVETLYDRHVPVAKTETHRAAWREPVADASLRATSGRTNAPAK